MAVSMSRPPIVLNNHLVQSDFERVHFERQYGGIQLTNVNPATEAHLRRWGFNIIASGPGFLGYNQVPARYSYGKLPAGWTCTPVPYGEKGFWRENERIIRDPDNKERLVVSEDYGALLNADMPYGLTKLKDRFNLACGTDEAEAGSLVLHDAVTEQSVTLMDNPAPQRSMFTPQDALRYALCKTVPFQSTLARLFTTKSSRLGACNVAALWDTPPLTDKQLSKVARYVGDYCRWESKLSLS